jgi:hypothetical protein
MRDFQHTLNVLVKAYLNDTLRHGRCNACAVGNILGGSEWKYFFTTIPIQRVDDSIYHKQKFNDYNWIDGLEPSVIRSQRIKGAQLIEKSGYTKLELARIEWAFETAPRNCNINDIKNDEWMFNGLMAVVDVLADIHGISLEEKEVAKTLFVKV